MAEFGRNVGMAFQLMDDILDFTADPKVLGKNLLADIREGKMTLPVILAMRKSPEIKNLLQELDTTDDPNRLGEVAVKISEAVQSLGTAETVKTFAVRHTEEGLYALQTLRAAHADTIRIIGDLASALLRRDF
jgi:geranylgeranyl pyrophosphate synthase